MQLHWPATTSAPDLADDEAHAWAVPLVADVAARQALWSTLSADERQRADEFRFDHLRQRFVIAHGALRKVLSCYLDRQPQDVTFHSMTAANRAWMLPAPRRNCISIFHIPDDLALILVAKDCEIGVDIEHIRDVSRMEQIAQRFFHPAEARRCPGHCRLTRATTLSCAVGPRKKPCSKRMARASPLRSMRFKSRSPNRMKDGSICRRCRVRTGTRDVGCNDFRLAMTMSRQSHSWAVNASVRCFAFSA